MQAPYQRIFRTILRIAAAICIFSANTQAATYDYTASQTKTTAPVTDPLGNDNTYILSNLTLSFQYDDANNAVSNLQFSDTLSPFGTFTQSDLAVVTASSPYLQVGNLMFYNGISYAQVLDFNWATGTLVDTINNSNNANTFAFTLAASNGTLTTTSQLVSTNSVPEPNSVSLIIAASLAWRYALRRRGKCLQTYAKYSMDCRRAYATFWYAVHKYCYATVLHALKYFLWLKSFLINASMKQKKEAGEEFYRTV